MSYFVVSSATGAAAQHYRCDEFLVAHVVWREIDQNHQVEVRCSHDAWRWTVESLLKLRSTRAEWCRRYGRNIYEYEDDFAKQKLNRLHQTESFRCR